MGLGIWGGFMRGRGWGGFVEGVFLGLGGGWDEGGWEGGAG